MHLGEAIREVTAKVGKADRNDYQADIFFYPVTTGNPKPVKGKFWHTGLVYDGNVYELFDHGKYAVTPVSQFTHKQDDVILIKNVHVDPDRIKSELKSGTSCGGFVARAIGFSDKTGAYKEVWPQDVYDYLTEERPMELMEAEKEEETSIKFKPWDRKTFKVCGDEVLIKARTQLGPVCPWNKSQVAMLWLAMVSGLRDENITSWIEITNEMSDTKGHKSYEDWLVSVSSDKEKSSYYKEPDFEETQAKKDGNESDTTYYCYHGGGKSFLQAFLSGKSKGYRLERGGLGIQIHPDVDPSTSEHPAYVSRVQYYASRTYMWYDTPVELKCEIEGKYLLAANNSYEAGIPYQHVNKIKNVRLKDIPLDIGVFPANFDKDAVRCLGLFLEGKLEIKPDDKPEYRKFADALIKEWVEEDKSSSESVLEESQESVKKNYMELGLIDLIEFTNLLVLDPTHKESAKYFEWIVSEYVNERDRQFKTYERKKPFIKKLRDAVSDFDHLAKEGKVNDKTIASFSSLVELEEFLEGIEDKPTVLTKGDSIEEATYVIEVLRKNNFQAYIVGGSVRDMVLGKKPKDFDIASSALPEEVVNLFPKVIRTGEQHGTVTVMINHHPYEVTTFRRDTEHTGRHATVVYTKSLDEDLPRRDFTMNAMAYDPTTKKIIDPFGGQKDIKNKIIRCVGKPEDRFHEDYLRMLRAIRFATILGFSLDPKILSTIKQLVPHMKKLSRERVRDELFKTLSADPERVVEGMRLWQTTGIMKQVMPEVDAEVGFSQKSKWHTKDVWEHTLDVVENMCKLTPDPLLRFTALLHDIGKTKTRGVNDEGGYNFHGHDRQGAIMAEKICRRLAMSRKERVLVVKVIDSHIKIKNIKPTSSKQEAAAFIRENFDYIDELILLGRADMEKVDNTEAMDYIASIKGQVTAKKADAKPESILDGKEIIDFLGLKPGPEIKKVKNMLIDLQMAGKVKSREDAFEFLKRYKEGAKEESLSEDVLEESQKTVKQNYLEPGLIDKEEYDHLLKLDPTKDQKAPYFDWIVSEYVNERDKEFKDFGSKKEFLSTLHKELAAFNDLKTTQKLKGDDKNIQKYHSLKQLQTFVGQGFHEKKVKATSEKAVTKLKQKFEGLTEGKDYEIVYDSGKALLVWPRTLKASVALGSHKWCVSVNDSTHWTAYIKRNKTTYFILIPNKDHEDVNSKWIFTLDSEGVLIEIADAANEHKQENELYNFANEYDISKEEIEKCRPRNDEYPIGLFEPARTGNLEKIKQGLKHGAEIDAKDNNGYTALTWASRHGRTEIIKLLLDKDADVNVKNNDGDTALIWASSDGYTEIVKLLLDKGADINAKNKNGYTALIRASWDGNSATVKFLLDKGADVNAKDNDGDTAFIRASHYGYTEIVKLLLDKGADINAKNKNGYTALTWASRHGRTEIIKLLLDKDADVNVKNNDGDTALIRASRNGHEDVAKLLLDKGADINAKNKNGYTALTWASRHGHTEVVKVLLDKDADVNAKDNDGDTAFIRASHYGHEDVAKLLINAGADTTIKNNKGERAVDFTNSYWDDTLEKLVTPPATQAENSSEALVESLSPKERKALEQIAALFESKMSNTNIKEPLND